MLGVGAGRRAAGSALARRGTRGTGLLGTVAAGAAGAAGFDIIGDLLEEEEAPRRRRRRRALTQGDRDDISFITGMLGAPAGKQFALTLAGRSR